MWQIATIYIMKKNIDELINEGVIFANEEELKMIKEEDSEIILFEEEE